ncbi:hypothetical protein BS78_03G150200 [Paspalum vaginatum]|nr:hypothetical protein BS78_03G150200 [Paspalum vaginatum]
MRIKDIQMFFLRLKVTVHGGIDNVKMVVSKPSSVTYPLVFSNSKRSVNNGGIITNTLVAYLGQAHLNNGRRRQWRLQRGACFILVRLCMYGLLCCVLWTLVYACGYVYGYEFCSIWWIV